MQKYYIDKVCLVIKITYWSSLLLCLFSWMGLAFIVYGLSDTSWLKLICNFFAYLLEVRYIGRYLGIFTLVAPVIFVIISIKKRKFIVSELLIIALTWGVMLYAYTHGHT